ncbi:hypothetical protein [Antribacter gilvus]|uniref:hypothetical protein n=1 Tax=Antribacter gilvus TaxID=2304675 RepID=UPI000F78F655|nr:hypothetical protein [Antribacter gilvus]
MSTKTDLTSVIDHLAGLDTIALRVTRGVPDLVDRLLGGTEDRATPRDVDIVTIDVVTGSRSVTDEVVSRYDLQAQASPGDHGLAGTWVWAGPVSDLPGTTPVLVRLRLVEDVSG